MFGLLLTRLACYIIYNIVTIYYALQNLINDALNSYNCFFYRKSVISKFVRSQLHFIPNNVCTCKDFFLPRFLVIFNNIPKYLFNKFL